MKLSTWAAKQGISYQTAWRWWKAGKLPVPAKQMPSGTVIIEEITTKINQQNVVIYCRVSSHNKKDDLDRQIKRCKEFCNANGLIIKKVYKEIASGMNDNRRQLQKLFNEDFSTIVVEHKDRLTRFGFNYIETLLNKLGKNIIVIDRDKEEQDDLMKDLISIITSFCCRLYGMRRGKNKANKLKDELANDKNI